MGGILADLGLSSFQLDEPQRGFSFRDDGPLDMRFDGSAEVPTAADLLADLSEDALAQLFRRFGDEPHARRIARGLVEHRTVGPVTTTRQLAELVERLRPRRQAGRGSRLHPATLVFQALRIAVNDELTGLRPFVRDCVDALAPGGRLAIISFHRGEDREIKNALRDLSGRCTCPPELMRCECGRIKHVELLTKRPVEPSPQEAAENPRARSARLRVAEKVA